MSPLDAAALVLFLAPLADWTAAVILLLVARQKPSNAAVTERATMQVILAFAATFAAVLGWAALTRITVGRDVALLSLTAALMLISVPAVIWLVMLIRGDFGRDDG